VGRIGRLKDYQVLILINKGSASASEIFAGALRDNKKIKLVGDISFGKGTIQEPEQMKGGTGLHITISKWLTPSGYWVNEKGLDPDVKVEDNQDTKEDEQLDKALELINL
jgi:carboxyl-terminal processing protease